MDDNELRLYDVTIGPHRTRMRLNARDAESYGDNATLAADQPATSERSGPEIPAAKARPVTHNKMRGTDPAEPAAEGTK